MQENETTYNKKLAYNSTYNKEKYKNMNMRVKPDDAELINNYCNDIGMSRADFLIKAAKYIIENHIIL